MHYDLQPVAFLPKFILNKLCKEKKENTNKKLCEIEVFFCQFSISESNISMIENWYRFDEKKGFFGLFLCFKSSFYPKNCTFRNTTFLKIQFLIPAFTCFCKKSIFNPRNMQLRNMAKMTQCEKTRNLLSPKKYFVKSTLYQIFGQENNFHEIFVKKV